MLSDVVYTLTFIIGAGGSGGSGTMAKLSTMGGLVYLSLTCFHFGHIFVTLIRKGKGPAERELKAWEKEEYE